MHGRALPLGTHGDRSVRLVEAPMAPSYGDDQVEESPLGINFDALRPRMPRGSLIALMILLLALAAGAASTWFAKPVYSARATIQIDPQASRIPGAENVASGAEGTEKDRMLQTQVELLGSSSTARKVATKLNLANNPLFLREIGVEDEPAGPKRSAEVTAALQDRLSVSSPRDAGIVDVRFDSRDPVAAARIANTFADAFVSDSLKRRRVATDYTRRFLRGQFEVTKSRLEQAERNLVNYARSAGLGAAYLGGAGSAASDAVMAAYSRAQSNRMQAQQRWQRAMSAPEAGNPISIVDRAQTPALPTSPRPAMNMALAALVGALALGAIIARSRMDKKADASDDVARDVDAELLGVVPLPKDGEDSAFASSNPQSPGTEAHHAIFLALDRLARTADLRVLLLTSSGPNEGKSMIAVKLSANFAAAGKKVLMIDTDMQRGSLHRMLGLSNQPGLADLLARDSTCELTNVAQSCANRGFSVVARGETATNAAESLASRRFADLLDEASTLYDVVIMDGPPVLGLPDAPRLSGMADATVFVVRANQTLPEQARLAMRQLSEAGAEQIELVITEHDATEDVGPSDTAGSGHAAAEAEELVAEQPPRAETAPAPRQPANEQDPQPEPALPSSWASWVVAQQ